MIRITLLLLVLTSCGFQSLPQSQNEVEAGWAEVLNQYKRRADLIPSIVETVKGYASHEKETLMGVIEARANATKVTLNVDQLTPETMKQFEKAQQGLAGALSRLMMVSERYPDLKANQNFRDLQIQLEGTENRISTARTRYIEVIKGFNNLVTVPPTSWTNSVFYKFDKKPQFSADASVEKVPEIKF